MRTYTKNGFGKTLRNFCSNSFFDCETSFFILSVCDNIEDMLDDNIFDNRLLSKVMYLSELIEIGSSKEEKEIKKVIRESAYYLYGKQLIESKHKVVVIGYLKESLKLIKATVYMRGCFDPAELKKSLQSDFKTVKSFLEPELNSNNDCEFF